MKMTRTLLIAALSVCASCTVGFEEQTVELRHDAETDVLDLRLSYKRLHAGGAALNVARDWVRDVLAKERKFIVAGWPFEFDFEEGTEQWLKDRISVLEARAVKGDDLSLNLEQRLQCASIQDCLDRANKAINVGVVTSLGAADLAVLAGDDDIDEQTLGLALAQAQRNESWVLLREGALELRLPCSQAQLHRILAFLAAPPDGAEEAHDFLTQVVGLLGELDYTAGRLTLRFPLDMDHPLRLDFTGKEPKGDSLAREFYED